MRNKGIKVYIAGQNIAGLDMGRLSNAYGFFSGHVENIIVSRGRSRYPRIRFNVV